MRKKVYTLTSLVIMVMFIITALTTPAICKAGTNNEPSAYHARNNAKGHEIVFDLLIIRPFFFGAMTLGSAGYVITLPFTLIGKNAKYAGKKLVVEPAKYTFTYPLGSY